MHTLLKLIESYPRYNSLSLSLSRAPHPLPSPRAPRQVVTLRRFGSRGAPWDFNLRDLFRWCELIEAEQQPPHWRPWQYVDVLFLQRMRTPDDRQSVLDLYATWLGGPDREWSHTSAAGADVGDGSGAIVAALLQPHYSISREMIQVGASWLPRAERPVPEEAEERPPPLVLHCQLRPLRCVPRWHHLPLMTTDDHSGSRAYHTHSLCPSPLPCLIHPSRRGSNDDF